jgi:hypothetical protein
MDLPSTDNDGRAIRAPLSQVCSMVTRDLPLWMMEDFSGRFPIISTNHMSCPTLNLHICRAGPVLLSKMLSRTRGREERPELVSMNNLAQGNAFYWIYYKSFPLSHICKRVPLVLFANHSQPLFYTCARAEDRCCSPELNSGMVSEDLQHRTLLLSPQRYLCYLGVIRRVSFG